MQNSTNCIQLHTKIDIDFTNASIAVNLYFNVSVWDLFLQFCSQILLASAPYTLIDLLEHLGRRLKALLVKNSCF